MSEGLRDLLTYGFCGVLVLLYASARFNTPPSNRTSTIRLWYWQGLTAYMVACLILFGVRAVILEQPALRDFLLKYPTMSGGSGGDATSNAAMEQIRLIPPALAATLIMTALLPTVPYIKKLDDSLLQVFLRMACIPVEVMRRARILNYRNLRLIAADLKEIVPFVQDMPIPNEALQYLRASAQTQWEDSELRFTKLLLAYRRLDALQQHARYGGFFAENAAEYKALREEMEDFVARAVRGMAQASRLRALESKEEYEELIGEKREAFKVESIKRFDTLIQFLTRAVVQCELSERDVQDRLHRFGFETVAVERVFIPIHQLAMLAIIMLVYLLASIALVPPPAEQQRAAMLTWVPFLIALANVTTIGFTLWFMQRFAWARREDGQQRPFASYIACGVLSVGITAVICVLFELARVGTVPSLQRLHALLPFMLICGALCMCVAAACDDAAPSVPEPWWFRYAEAVGCSVAILGAAWLVTSVFPPPRQLPQWWWVPYARLAGVAFVVGAYVPSMYRDQRRRRAAINGRACEEVDAADPVGATLVAD